MIFKDFWILFFFPIVVFIIFFISKKNNNSTIMFSSGELIKNFRPSIKIFLAKNLIYLRIFILFLFFLSLARPQKPLQEMQVQTEGIDMVLAVDASTSMLAEDFEIRGRRKNRLEVVKTIVKEFISNRKSDRIAIVAFAKAAYTVCPLTLDYSWLRKNLERVRIGDIEDGTAIGSAISSSLNRLKKSKAKSRIIILLTDGVNNSGRISPLEAADLAKALNIKIYTIGVGKKGLVPYPVRGFWGRKSYQNVEVKIDEDTLKEIANKTKAKYYRATDTNSLRKIYKEIDALEKTSIEETGFAQYKELFPYFLILALVLLILEITLSNTYLRQLP